VLTSSQVKEKALELGFHKVGIADAKKDHQDGAQVNLEKWLSLGYHANLAWMENEHRRNIRQYMPDVASVIVLAINYYTEHQHCQDPNFGKISRYGWGADYHKIIRNKLKQFSLWLEAQDQNIKTRFCVDTSPLQEKAWAQRAGLGWIAKNSNLITREYGSWVFISEVLINISLRADLPANNHCGTCSKCIDSCPTSAIVEPYVIDSSKCIAYHTIENREDQLPSTISAKLEQWVAGCDICQDVCPWNQRFAKVTDIDGFNPYPENLSPKLSDLATISDEQWQKQTQGSALRRIKATMIRRNARANLKS